MIVARREREREKRAHSSAGDLWLGTRNKRFRYISFTSKYIYISLLVPTTYAAVLARHPMILGGRHRGKQAVELERGDVKEALTGLWSGIWMMMEGREYRGISYLQV